MSAAVMIKPAYLDRGDAAKFLAISETTMFRLVNTDPNFPKPRELSGRRVAWLVRELEAWAEKRPIANNLPPENTGHGNRPKAGQAPLAEQRVA